MLNFALEYWKALDMISGEHEMELRQYELSEGEWRIVKQLWDVLKVHFDRLFSHACLGIKRCSRSLPPVLADSQRHNTFLLKINS
jgi:hypothetical protein